MVHTSFLVYADNVNISDGSLHTKKKNTKANKETGLEVNAYKTKY